MLYSGLMDADHPYRLAVGPEPDAPSLIELPGHWSLDDWEPYNYLPGITGSGVIANPMMNSGNCRPDSAAATSVT